MRPPIDFSESYKLISNTELLNILDHPGDYQPLAVEAAKNELLKRQLSETEIKEAREPIIAKQIQKEKQREKTKEIENKLKTAGYTLIDTLNSNSKLAFRQQKRSLG
jgi:CRISPR/Cas system-associated protein Csx1